MSIEIVIDNVCMNRALLVADVQGLSNNLILSKSIIFVIFEYDSTQLFLLNLLLWAWPLDVPLAHRN